MVMQGVHGVKDEPYAVLGTGRKAVGGNNVATQLSTIDTKVAGAYVSADPDGGQQIAIGDSNVGSGSGSWRGVIVYPGHPGIWVKTDNLTKIYFSGATGAVACFTFYI